MSLDKALAFTLRWEGGYVNHPADKGGETNFGITTKVYDDYRESHGVPPRSVRDITQVEVRDIYTQLYWLKAGCGKVLPPLDMALFDFAVNSGPSTAIKHLQICVGATPDGVIGPKTLAALQGRSPAELAKELCKQRELLFKRIAEKNPSQAVFLRGWLNRLTALLKEL